MTINQMGWSAVTAAVLLAVSWTAPAAEKQFALTSAIPDDVYLCIATRHNPEREFLEHYWEEVFDSLKHSGIGQDLMGLIGSLLGEQGMAELERLKERAAQLVAGVDWQELGGGEMVFAERMMPPTQLSPRGIHMGPPNMVWLFRGNSAGASRNFEGLASILEAIVAEINQAIGSERLHVDRSTRLGAKIASTNLTEPVPEAPALPIAVAQRDNVVLITLGDKMLSDVLTLLDAGGKARGALGHDPRFQAAFAELPPAEDQMVFFDMQAMIKPFHNFMDMAVGAIKAPHDMYDNTGMGPEGGTLNARALAAYRRGDTSEALQIIHEAYKVAPTSCIVLYNLACFNALEGNRDEALEWLDKAVDAGFHAPSKIRGDTDLASLRDDPRYEAALAKATEMAEKRAAKDIIVNSSKYGEAFKLTSQAWEVYKAQDYEQGLRLVEQAYELAPADSRVLYYLACFHSLLGHRNKALDFLEQAVDGGFYSPRFISKDPDLQSIRDDPRYEAALARARKKAAEAGAQQTNREVALAKGVADRMMHALEILDYSATVSSTDGYSVRTDTISVLVPDAESRPIYPVFGKRAPMTKFDRFLPQETMSFSVSNGFDVDALYRYLEETFRGAGPMGAEFLAKWSAVQDQIGVDVKKDVLGWLDGQMVSVTLEANQGSVVMIKVTDEEVAREKVGAAVTFMTTKLSELMTQVPQLAMVSMQTSPVQHERLKSFQNLHFAFSPQPVVYGLAEGHLIFGTSPQAVLLCLDTAKGDHPSIRENPRVMAEALLPDGPFSSVQLNDQRRLGQQLATGMGVVSMMSGTMMMAAPNPEARAVIAKVAAMLAKLTPVMRQIDFYKSTASYTTTNGRAWRTHMVTHYVSPDERSAPSTP